MEQPDDPSVQQYGKTSADVVEALGADGEAHVLISLDSTDDPTEIALAQDRVLASLDDLHFKTRIRFDAVPALAGIVYSELALVSLESHPDVLAVALDAGGTGG